MGSEKINGSTVARSGTPCSNNWVSHSFISAERPESGLLGYTVFTKGCMVRVYLIRTHGYASIRGNRRPLSTFSRLFLASFYYSGSLFFLLFPSSVFGESSSQSVYCDYNDPHFEFLYHLPPIMNSAVLFLTAVCPSVSSFLRFPPNIF